ncbi:actin-domain-containing protein [Paraphysoderma sedebokerense]|nr:actin-domain-containing protein [Paraphysoderma sedebokerense]
MTGNTLVVDNGAYSIKAGWAHIDHDPKIIPNAIIRGKSDRRILIADEVNSVNNVTGIYYKLPFEKGYLTNWEVQKGIWDRLFNDVLQVDPTETQLIVTEPMFNLPNIQLNYDQIVFEEYDFQSYYRTSGPHIATFNPTHHLFSNSHTGSPSECILIVDSGYSFTHIVPFVNNVPIRESVKRLNVGGKLLTNHLKEVISFRQWNMMDETYLINLIKERTCFVSTNAARDLAVCKRYPRDLNNNPILREYVLPDGATNITGYVKTPTEIASPNPDEQILYMNHERFMVPEVLFHPSDIGMDQAGIAEAIVQSVMSAREEYRGLLFANIVLAGGNCMLNGFVQRLLQELRPLVPAKYDVRIGLPENPVTYTYSGGVCLANQHSHILKDIVVTRKEYEEFGSTVWNRKMSDGNSVPSEINLETSSKTYRDTTFSVVEPHETVPMKVISKSRKPSGDSPKSKELMTSVSMESTAVTEPVIPVVGKKRGGRRPPKRSLQMNAPNNSFQAPESDQQIPQALVRPYADDDTQSEEEMS